MSDTRATRITRTVAGEAAASAHRFTRINAFVIYKTAADPGIPRYAAQLQDLLPLGKAWTRARFANLTKVLIGMASEFERVHLRGEDLLREMDPGTSVELLPDWERVLGLPDECAPVISSLSERQAAAATRWRSRGSSQSASRVSTIEEIASTLGASMVFVRRFFLHPFTCDSECDDILNSSRGYFRWEVEAVHVSGEIDAFLECQVRRAMVSDRYIEFSHPLALFSQMTFTRSGTAEFIDPNDGSYSTLAADELGESYVGI